MRVSAVTDALEALEGYARAFDQVSAETDAHYSARAVVRWVRLGVTYKRQDTGRSPWAKEAA